jgi:hypothetical protein
MSTPMLASTTESPELIELLQKAESLSGLPCPEDEFLIQIVELMLAAVEGSAVLLWQRIDAQTFQLKVVSGVDVASVQDGALADKSFVFREQLSRVRQVFETGQACMAPPGSLLSTEIEDDTGFDAGYGHHRQFILPIHGQGHCAAVVAIYQPAHLDRDHKRDLALLAALCARIEVWYRDQTCLRLEDELAQRQRVLAVADAVTRNLDHRQTAFEVVNQLRWYFGVDRVTLAIQRGNTCRVEAISGQPVFDPRSNVVRRLELLAQQVASTGESLWYPASVEVLAPRLRQRIDSYLEAASTKSIALLPISRSPNPSDDPEDLAQLIRPADTMRGACLGLIILEAFDSELERGSMERYWECVERSVTSAVANSRQYHSLFLLPLWRALGKCADLFRGRRRNKALAASVLVAAVIAALVLIPTDFKLRSEGTIQPANRARVYSEASGTVTELLARDGDWVESGQELLRLSNPELGAQLAAAEGQLRESEEQLRAIMLQRLQGDVQREQDERALVRNAAGLEAKIAGLRRQRDLLLLKQSQLSIRSPVAGQLITWDVEKRLQGRPVSPGDLLMTIADPNGPWELELRMPDKRAGYLLDTWLQRERRTDTLRTSYVLASDPLRVRSGVVKDVSPSSDVVEGDGNVVRVRVHIEGEELMNARAGTSVIAHVHCGRRSLGFSKLYEFFDWSRRTWFAIY